MSDSSEMCEKLIFESIVQNMTRKMIVSALDSFPDMGIQDMADKVKVMLQDFDLESGHEVAGESIVHPHVQLCTQIGGNYNVLFIYKFSIYFLLISVKENLSLSCFKNVLSLKIVFDQNKFFFKVQ